MAHVVITGGGGLVGANVARAVLAADPESRVQLLDVDPDPGPALSYIAGGQGAPNRVEYHRADLTDPHPLAVVDRPGSVTHVVHAAAFCHVPEWEQRDAMRFVDVNVEGTRRVLEWVRALPALRRTVHVSSGGVYGDPTRWSTPAPQGEDGPFNPPETYAISKLAGEQLARRWGELHGLDIRVVRLSAVFGAMERRTPGRLLMSLPYAAARCIRLGRPLAVSARTLRAGGDWLSAVDVAAGITALLDAPELRHPAYNIAHGTFTDVTELLDAISAHTPGFRITTDGESDVDMDPEQRLARWNAYDTTRLERDTGWSARPLAVQVAEYLDWVRADALTRAP